MVKELLLEIRYVSDSLTVIFGQLERLAHKVKACEYKNIHFHIFLFWFYDGRWIINKQLHDKLKKNIYMFF